MSGEHMAARYWLTDAGWQATGGPPRLRIVTDENRRPCPQCTHWASNHTRVGGCAVCEAQGRVRICGWSRDAIEAGER